MHIIYDLHPSYYTRYTHKLLHTYVAEGGRDNKLPRWNNFKIRKYPGRMPGDGQVRNSRTCLSTCTTSALAESVWCNYCGTLDSLLKACNVQETMWTVNFGQFQLSAPQQPCILTPMAGSYAWFLEQLVHNLQEPGWAKWIPVVCALITGRCSWPHRSR